MSITNKSNISYSSSNVIFYDKNYIENDNANKMILLKSPETISDTYTLTMPGTKVKDNHILKTDSNGNLSWIDLSLNSLDDVSYNKTNSYSIYIGTDPANDTDTAINNTSVGYQALNSITEGDNNTVLGFQAGASLTTGSTNTCIGSGSSTNAVDSINQTSIGFGAQCSGNNQITLGNGDVTTLRCSTATISTVSDKRDKINIKDSTYGLDFINKIKPRTFTWNKRILNKDDEHFSKQGKEELGFIAQEIQTAMEGENKELLDLVLESNLDRLEIKSGNLLPIMVKAIQDLNNKVLLLENELNKIKIKE